MNTDDPTPRKAVEYLMEQDREIIKSFAISLCSVAPGEVSLEMPIAQSMVNSQKICHGGFLFTLADTACAYAAASMNVAPVSTEANISFVGGAKESDRVCAKATVDHSSGKVLHASVRIERQDGMLIALYRGAVLSRGKVQ
jgi:acyl-CoA thioesterase